MNDYFIHPVKTYKAEEWLSVREFGRNIPFLPDGEFIHGEMARGASFGNAFKTAIINEEPESGFYDWWDQGQDDFFGNVKEVLDQFGNRYGDHYILCFDKNADNAEKMDALQKALYLMIGALSATYSKYQPVLNAFKAKEAGLMGDIKTTSSAVARFNDTPQNSGTFDDDPHTTNITQSSGETSSAGATPIQRLDEVRRGWRNIIKEWADELGALTIEGANL